MNTLPSRRRILAAATALILPFGAFGAGYPEKVVTLVVPYPPGGATDTLGRILPYDPLKSFESIGLVGSSPLVLLAHPALPANTVQELVALAKAQPGKLSFASFGNGTTSSPSMPKLPSVAQSGYPEYEMVPWITVVAPRGLQPAVQTRLVKAFADTLADPAIRAELEKAGVDVAYQPPAAYDEKVTRELPLMRAYVHKAQIQAE